MIRRANKNDIEAINSLLRQVLTVHNNIRPDLFKSGAKKYTDEELISIIKDDNTPVFVYEEDRVLGYCFCVFRIIKDDNILKDIKTLYIDDLCVDSAVRGKGVGTKLYEYVLKFAKQSGCFNVTLNVWEGNDNALKFYESKNMKKQKTVMEVIL